MTTNAQRRRAKKPPKAPTHLDLGCGTRKQADHWGVDVQAFPGVDQVLDLRKPWPWKDGSIQAVYSSHFVEHLTGLERVAFFNELWRVLAVGAKATIIVPHWSNTCAYGDPTHQWPPMSEWFALYLDVNWRATNAPHTGYTCDFEYVVGFSFDERVMPWNDERRMFGLAHYQNAIRDMHATLTKRALPKS